MSASAVPSTLESPQDPPVRAATAGGAVVMAASTDAPAPRPTRSTEHRSCEETTGRDVRDDAPPGDAAVQDPCRRVGPATMMSPAVIAPLPGESTPPLAPENAVVDVGAPAHAFVPYGSGAPAGFGGPHGMMHHGSAGPGGASGAAHGRTTSTTFLLLIVGGIVAAVALLAIAVSVSSSSPGAGRRRRMTRAARASRASRVAPRVARAAAPSAAHGRHEGARRRDERGRARPRGGPRRGHRGAAAHSMRASPRPSSSRRTTSRRTTTSRSRRTVRSGAPSPRRRQVGPPSSTLASSRTSARSACRGRRELERREAHLRRADRASLSKPAHARSLASRAERMTISFMVR